VGLLGIMSHFPLSRRYSSVKPQGGFVIRAKHELTRIELYEKVRSIPMRTLAKEFGISDVGLAKLCRRHKIPLPGRGYWARIQYGQKPTKDALPEVANATLESVTVYPSEPKPRGYLNPADGENLYAAPFLKLEDENSPAVQTASQNSQLFLKFRTSPPKQEQPYAAERKSTSPVTRLTAC
jgi:hypothetical protein